MDRYKKLHNLQRLIALLAILFMCLFTVIMAVDVGYLALVGVIPIALLILYIEAGSK